MVTRGARGSSPFGRSGEGRALHDLDDVGAASGDEPSEHVDADHHEHREGQRDGGDEEEGGLDGLKHDRPTGGA